MSDHKHAYPLYLTNVCLVLASLIAFLLQSYEIVFIVTLMFVVSSSPLFLKRTCNIFIPASFVFGSLFFIFATLFLGEFGSMYDRFWWYDAFLHFVSAIVLGIIGFFIIYIFYSANRLRLPQIIIFTFAFFFSLGMGALWEITEFFIDKTLGMNMQVGSLDDTMYDLILDALGGLVAVLIGYLYINNRTVPLVSPVIDRMAEEVLEENKALAEAVQHG